MKLKLLALAFVLLIQGSLIEAAENIAYKRTVTATSIESSQYKAEYAVDGDGNTRWSSQSYDNQNFIVDLWKVYTVATVKIHWEAAYATQFQIQVSTDNNSWKTVYENYEAKGGTMSIKFTPSKAQFVKIYLIKRATVYGFSIIEFEIYEDSGHVPLDNLVGKTFFFLGSSVTYGYAAGGVSFVEYIAERNDCTSVKEAVSGTTLVDNGPSSYVQRMKNNLNKQQKCDHFICQLSTNDASQNKPLGTIGSSYNINDFDTSTICGAIEYIIAYVKQTWNCPISFYTNTYYANGKYEEMINALYKIKDKWGIGIIDLYNNEEMRKVSPEDKKRWMADDVHPTSAGYLEWWTPVFEDYLQNYVYYDEE